MQVLSDSGYTPSTSHHGASAFKDENLFTDSYALDLADEQLPPSSVPETWGMRYCDKLRARAPHASNNLERLVLYIGGPRPRIDLPYPVPALDRLYKFHNLRFTLSLESTFSKWTRPLTTPWLLVILGAAYIIGLAFLTRTQSFLAPSDSYIRCTSSFWLANDRCGVDGQLCLPFNYSSFDFRCPAQCNDLILQNPRTVGNEKMAYVPLIVGGGDNNRTYRGDSFICAAAIQAGMISSSKGGCASLQLIQNFTNFLPYAANGLSSIGFPTVFPISYTFSHFTSLGHCDDLRNPVLAFNVIITFLLFTLLRPKPIVLFWCLVSIGFWHVALFSQPLGPPPEISTEFGTFLPALFVAYMFWRVSFRFTLPSSSKAPLESSFLYLVPYWVGVLHNLTFGQLPLSRLTASDIAKRRGAIITLAIGLVVITVLVINQVRVIRKTGWLPYYLGWYILGGMVIMVLALLPGMQLRIHHYILAMVLMPLTAFPTRLSIIYQGLLLGLFLNGTAAFGFASIVETAAQLRLDGAIGSTLPTFLTNSTNYNTSIPFHEQVISWAPFQTGQGWDSYALLVDDVERYLGTNTIYSLAALNASLPHFFRLAFTSGGSAGDFTMSAVLWPNGTWVDPTSPECTMGHIPLPFSLSPHICILSSPDLSGLLESSSLPPLPQLLQSFSPLPNVTTRSTSLTSIPHSSFNLRFSDLSEIETACREDDGQRAVRMIDWITARLNRHCARWVQDIESTVETERSRTPWWDELRHSVEGDRVPSKAEGWNHPVSIILAVSTMVANPLQAIAALRARALDFPPWVDNSLFRYTLIIHPRSSPLSSEEASALFNAVKKQYGLHSYLLPLDLPSPPPPPVPVPVLLPCLPPPGQEISTVAAPSVGALRLRENDIHQTGKFTREFLVMSLLPWMEKCVLEWNENFTSTRRLPSRLFSSTRRLFGSPSPSPAPLHHTSSSISSMPRSSQAGRVDITLLPPSQQRRLAEFATILGDYKLATTVWEALRKDGKGGEDILPILLTPSAAIPTYAFNALLNISPSPTELLPQAQLRALIYAVRWEASIPTSDFLGDVLGGERWLVWAAGDAEEVPSALLLAHAALLCTRKDSNRRAALWYLMAANKLERIGIKPLTMHFLRKAQEFYQIKPQKSLSPSFWDSEYEFSKEICDFDAIPAGIEHPLGRLLYTTGDIAGAVKLFVGLLRGSTMHNEQQTGNKAFIDPQGITSVKLFLEDFRVAFNHLKSTINDKTFFDQLRLPVQFCDPRLTRVRLNHDCFKQDDPIWELREEAWLSFRKKQGGNEQLEKSGKAMVGETFWIDLAIQNPLDTEINLSNLTIVVRKRNGLSASADMVQVEVVGQVILGAREKQTVSISIRPLKPAKLVLHQVTYDFLSLLPSVELLSFRGRRLNDTHAQRQKPTYAPDICFEVDALETDHGLAAVFLEDSLSLLQGEYKDLRILLSNTGTKPITEIWIVAAPEDEIWLEGSQDVPKRVALKSEVLQSPNSLHLDVVYRVPNVATEELPLQSGDSREISFKFHVDGSGQRELSLLLTYREGRDMPFQSIRLSKEYEVRPLLEFDPNVRLCESTEHLYMIDLEITSNHPSSTVELVQVTTVSPSWECTSLKQERISLHPSQCSRIIIGASPWAHANGARETLEFVSASLGDIIVNGGLQQRGLPTVELLCSHVHEAEDRFSMRTPMIQHFFQRKRQQLVSQNIAQTFPQLPDSLYPSVFPLHNPFAVDILVFWFIPFSNRLGHVSVPGLTLGARHAIVKEIIETADNAKIKSKALYAETRREQAGVLDAIRNSQWNLEINPLSVSVQNPGLIVHDFSSGPCISHISVVVRNCSITHTVQFVLKFAAAQEQSFGLVGRTTFRGTLDPCQSMVVRPKLIVAHPGTYPLDCWTLTAEMLETSSTGKVPFRHYDLQPSSRESARLIVSDVRSTVI